jgi:hypothetical protein
VAGSCELDNAPSASIEGHKCLEELRNCWLRKTDFVLWNQSVMK